ncbi:MAG: hypothetical protein AAF353_12875, partial [Pseudomonadota bacterium]
TEEIKKSGIQFTYDAHGHPELGNVSKAHIVNVLVQRRLKQLKIDIKSRPVEMGYELRCCRPVAFDLTLCTILGMGVKKLYEQELTLQFIRSGAPVCLVCRVQFFSCRCFETFVKCEYHLLWALL